MTGRPNIIDYLKISPESATIKDIYIQPEEFINNYKKANILGKDSVLRFYIINNGAYIFREKPFVGEILAQYLADKLAINAVEVKIIGSAKTGFSMGIDHFGSAFGKKSDLDLSIINQEYFQKLADEFYLWSELFNRKKIFPKSEIEKRYWADNDLNCPKNIKTGFIDTYKIPNREEFPIARDINNSLYLIKVNLYKIEHIQVSNVSVRVYKSWKSFINQLKVNTDYVLSKVTRK